MRSRRGPALCAAGSAPRQYNLLATVHPVRSVRNRGMHGPGSTRRFTGKRPKRVEPSSPNGSWLVVDCHDNTPLRRRLPIQIRLSSFPTFSARLRPVLLKNATEETAFPLASNGGLLAGGVPSFIFISPASSHSESPRSVGPLSRARTFGPVRRRERGRRACGGGVEPSGRRPPRPPPHRPPR